MAEVNKALTAATIDRVNKFDTYSQLKAGLSPDYSGAPADSPFQRLRNQYATLSQDYARRLATVRPEYPEMQRLKSEIDSVKADLQVESNKMTDSAYGDYQAALKKEESLKGPSQPDQDRGLQDEQQLARLQQPADRARQQEFPPRIPVQAAKRDHSLRPPR